MKPIILFICGLILANCSEGFGNKLASEKLDIYFDDKGLQQKADDLGEYWSKNGLIGDRKQSIKLTKVNEIIEVRLIRSEEFKTEKLTVEEFQLLLDLKQGIQSKVFDNKQIRLLLCDNEFKSEMEIKE